MGIDLNALAAQLADQLATSSYDTREGDAASRRAPEEPLLAPVVEPPRGVRFCATDARVGDYVDHTLLRPDATRAEVERLCGEALEHRFAAVCVNPAWVAGSARLVAGSRVQVATVIGFPLGANASPMKAAEAALAVRQGAHELDMVVALGPLRAGEWGEVERDIETVVKAAEGALVKVIIESALLAPLEIVRACHAARDAGADYVKTSTGFHAAGGASAAAVALMRMAVGDTMGVKASGGIRDGAAAFAMFAAGATRIGTSAGVSMADERGPGPRPIGELLGGVPASAAAVAPVY
ncbi:MAG TPA: deoxyribose-phosphate aldolase [Gemmatimonadales bacterium]